MDALSDLLSVVGLSGGVFIDAEFTEPWSVAGRVSAEACRPFMTPPQEVIGFHYVTEGRFRVRIEGEPECEIGAGEAVMLPRNDMHAFGYGRDLPPILISDLIQPPNALGMSRMVHGGGGPRTRLICGFLGGNEQLRPLLVGLPRVMPLRLADLPGGDWLEGGLAYAAQTLAEGRPGAATVLTKISELLFTELVRHYLGELPPEQTGWLAGLRDPIAGRALSLLHTRVAEPWTTEALAGEVAMSRSAFADRFTAVVGQPPMRYLTAWRMQLAQQKLRETHANVAQIAFDVGYESEAAFARAFRRECGVPPAQWRRDAR
ncbi:MAG TPA: AraC family transcriptional regulator [Phenylobacterium sp.]